MKFFVYLYWNDLDGGLVKGFKVVNDNFDMVWLFDSFYNVFFVWCVFIVDVVKMFNDL